MTGQPPEGLIAAQAVAKRIVARVLPEVREGVTERQLSDRVLEVAAELGSIGVWSQPTTRLGLGTLVAHPEFPMQDRPARIGDTVIIDVNPTIDGWLGDFCVSAVVGESTAAGELVAEVHGIQRRMIELIRPGMPASEFFRLSAQLIASHDLKILDLLDNVGHSIGEAFAADGFIDATNDTPMYGAWTLEPHLGRSARGAKFEDIVWLVDGADPVVI